MSDLVRFGVAIERPLLSAFDEHIGRRGYENRSEALRDLVRAELAREAWERGAEAAATISLIYDHHVRELSERLVTIQHEFGARIVCTTHVHLDHNHCLEVIIVRGPSSTLKRLADRLLGTKGVISGSVTGLSVVAPRSSTGAEKTKGKASARGHAVGDGAADPDHGVGHGHGHGHGHGLGRGHGDGGDGGR